MYPPKTKRSVDSRYYTHVVLTLVPLTSSWNLIWHEKACFSTFSTRLAWFHCGQLWCNVANFFTQHQKYPGDSIRTQLDLLIGGHFIISGSTFSIPKRSRVHQPQLHRPHPGSGKAFLAWRLTSLTDGNPGLNRDNIIYITHFGWASNANVW